MTLTSPGLAVSRFPRATDLTDISPNGASQVRAVTDRDSSTHDAQGSPKWTMTFFLQRSTLSIRSLGGKRRERERDLYMIKVFQTTISSIVKGARMDTYTPAVYVINCHFQVRNAMPAGVAISRGLILHGSPLFRAYGSQSKTSNAPTWRPSPNLKQRLKSASPEQISKASQTWGTQWRGTWHTMCKFWFSSCGDSFWWNKDMKAGGTPWEYNRKANYIWGISCGISARTVMAGLIWNISWVVASAGGRLKFLCCECASIYIYIYLVFKIWYITYTYILYTYHKDVMYMYIYIYKCISICILNVFFDICLQVCIFIYALHITNISYIDL